MANEICKQIQGFLDEHKLPYHLEENEQFSMIMARFEGKNIKHLLVRLICENENNVVSVRAFAIANAAKADKVKVLTLLNELNGKYRYTRFYMADNGEISAMYDLPTTCGEAFGPISHEMFIRFWNILDECYPELLAAVEPA